jgi:ABC-type uncharacterized transport system involved in gliding motility auxiliary subunit
MKNIFKKLSQVNLIQLLKLQKFERPMIYVVAVAIFLIINVLLSSVALRLDFSQGKTASLSPATEKILQKVDDVINITFYISSDIPSKLIPVRTEVNDLLNQYKNESKHIRVTVVDPKKNAKAAEEAQQLHIPQLQFQIVENDKYAVSNSYFGIAIAHGDKKEIIPQATDITGLEYNITAIIYKLSRKELPKVGIVGQEMVAMGQADEISVLRKVLQQQVTIEDVSLASGSAIKEVDSSFKTLLVFSNPDKEFDPNELDLIKKYLDKKGKAIFFVDGVWVNEQSLVTSDANHHLETILNDYGITIEKNLVLSQNAEMIRFGNDLFTYVAPYYLWVNTNIFNPNASYFSNLAQLIYPWSSSITLSKKQGVETKDIVKTTPQSWIQKDTFMLEPQTIPVPQPKDLKSYITTAEAEKKNGGKIMVISSSRFVKDRYLGQTGENLGFILNVVNDYASQGALSGIRDRGTALYPMPHVSESQKDLFKYGNMFILPLLFVMYGGYRLMKRK